MVVWKEINKRSFSVICDLLFSMSGAQRKFIKVLRDKEIDGLIYSENFW